MRHLKTFYCVKLINGDVDEWGMVFGYDVYDIKDHLWDIFGEYADDNDISFEVFEDNTHKYCYTLTINGLKSLGKCSMEHFKDREFEEVW